MIKDKNLSNSTLQVLTVYKKLLNFACSKEELISDFCLYGIVLNEYKESMEGWHTRLFYQVLLGLALFLPLSIEFPGKKGVDAN